METSLGLFLLSAAAVSFTGVVFPGPMTAATIAKGYGDKNAGAWIAVGHAIIEIPLIVAIYLGFGHLIGSPLAVTIICVVGGLALLYLGVQMFRTAGNAIERIGGLPNGLVLTGIVITGTNPAFYVWWATIGVALIAGAARFGTTGIILFTLVHWPCDLAWYEFLSVGTFKSRHWWTQKVQKAVFTVCALVLIGFGMWFCISAFL